MKANFRASMFVTFDVVTMMFCIFLLMYGGILFVKEEVIISYSVKTNSLTTKYDIVLRKKVGIIMMGVGSGMFLLMLFGFVSVLVGNRKALLAFCLFDSLVGLLLLTLVIVLLAHPQGIVDILEKKEAKNKGEYGVIYQQRMTDFAASDVTQLLTLTKANAALTGKLGTLGCCGKTSTTCAMEDMGTQRLLAGCRGTIKLLDYIEKVYTISIFAVVLTFVIALAVLSVV